MDFNPRTHEECDRNTLDSMLQENGFQSTHSRGVRLCRFCYCCYVFDYFNPRTHEECDGALVFNSYSNLISIHALTRSATYAIKMVCCGCFRFQSTHSRGVRQSSKWCWMKSTRFQSTHSRGVRPRSGKSKKYPSLFQSTHSRGVRPSSCIWISAGQAISIHALTRSATIMKKVK